MKYAKGDVPVVTRLIIQEETSPGNATPLLQHFPALLIPRVGDGISIAGVDGNFRVSDVSFTFHAHADENIQGVFLTVKRIS